MKNLPIHAQLPRTSDRMVRDAETRKPEPKENGKNCKSKIANRKSQ